MNNEVWRLESLVEEYEGKWNMTWTQILTRESSPFSPRNGAGFTTHYLPLSSNWTQNYMINHTLSQEAVDTGLMPCLVITGGYGGWWQGHVDFSGFLSFSTLHSSLINKIIENRFSSLGDVWVACDSSTFFQATSLAPWGERSWHGAIYWGKNSSSNHQDPSDAASKAYGLIINKINSFSS